MKFGVIGSGSWATALVKILSDNGQEINWWVRNKEQIAHIQKRRYNPQYLSSARLDISLLTVSDEINEVVRNSDVVLLVVPSAFIEEVLKGVNKNELLNKKILSAIKGIVPGADILLNDFLAIHFNIPIEN